jgi:hypothetical protein
MGNMSPDCISKLDDLICKDSKEVGNQALRGLYGQQSCCNDLQSLFKAVLIKGIQVKYNDPDASSPPIVLRAINKKQAECYCNWIDRQFPNDGTGGGGGGNQFVTYTMPIPGNVDLNLPNTFEAIPGAINILTSNGDWYDEGFGANAIGYGGSLPRNFSVSISVSVSSATPVSVDYSWQKSESGVMIYETIPQASATTPGGTSPHALVTYTAQWNPTQANDLFAVQIRQNATPLIPMILRVFSVIITEIP